MDSGWSTKPEKYIKTDKTYWEGWITVEKLG